jgi:hypothetical protein
LFVPFSVKRLLVHIGVGKTGSTSIQRALRRCAENGELGDVVYPRGFGGGGQLEADHNDVTLLYRSHERLTRGLKRRYPVADESYERARIELRGQLQQALSAAEQVVLSAEFFEALSAPELEEFVADCEAAGFHDRAFVMYVREPSALYLSRTQQYLKAAAEIRDPAAFRIKFTSVLARWRRIFSETFFLRHFDRAALVGSDVVSDFSSVLHGFFGVTISPGAAVERPRGLGPRLKAILRQPIAARQGSSGGSNVSLSAEGMIALQQHQRALAERGELGGRRSDRLVQALQRADAVLGGRTTKPVLKDALRDLIRANNAAEMERLASEYGLQLVAPFNSDSVVHTPEGFTYQSVSDVLEGYDAGVLEEILSLVEAERY